MTDFPTKPREIEPVSVLHRRRESVTAIEVLEFIKRQPEALGWLAAAKGIEIALDEICR